MIVTTPRKHAKMIVTLLHLCKTQNKTIKTVKAKLEKVIAVKVCQPAGQQASMSQPNSQTDKQPEPASQTE